MLTLSDPRIQRYVALLKQYNQHTNIYSEHAYDKLSFHLQDSLMLSSLIGDQQECVLDIGSGAGLPAVLMALQNPNHEVVGVESKSRKTLFLDQVVQELDLDNLRVLQADIHDVLRKKQVRPSVVTAKAFAPLPKLLDILKKLSPPFKIFVPISEAQTVLPDYVQKGFILDHRPYFYWTNTL